jgi:L-asparagine transporter-like permease
MLNILTEKVFIVLCLWFAVLAIATIVNFIWSAFVLLLDDAQKVDVYAKPFLSGK